MGQDYLCWPGIAPFPADSTRSRQTPATVFSLLAVRSVPHPGRHCKSKACKEGDKPVRCRFVLGCHLRSPIFLRTPWFWSAPHRPDAVTAFIAAGNGSGRGLGSMRKPGPDRSSDITQRCAGQVTACYFGATP
jgi:hypothetical protein